MPRLILAIFLVVAVPLLGLVTSQLAQGRMERNFTKELSAAAVQDSEAQRALDLGLSLRSHCQAVLSNPAADQREAAECRSYRRIVWLTWGSLFAVMLGLGLLGWILWAARAAAMDREKLLRLFGPGIRFVLFGLFALILVQSLVLSYSILTLEATYLKRIHWTAIALVLIGGVGGAFFMLKEGLSVFKRVGAEVVGVAIFRKDQEVLWNFVERIAKRLNATPPKNIVLGLEPTFYVTSADVRVQPKGFIHRGETLYLSLPLMRILTLPELAAIVGHELGHFRGDDTRFSVEFYPIYAGAGKALDSLQRGSDGLWERITLFPAMAILSLFFDRFEVVENTIGRERELEADKAGASVASPMAIALSLLKVGAYAPIWGELQNQLADVAIRGGSLPNASKEFVRQSMVRAASRPPKVSEVIEDEPLPHPTDTHPPTAERIKALGLKLEDVAKQPLTVEAATASARLVAGIDIIEENLTKQEIESIKDWMTRRDDDDD